MNLLPILVILGLSWGQTVSGANILALLNLPSPSLHIWNSPLLIALAERGHNVTILSTKAQKKPVPNITDLVFEGIYEFVENMEDFVLEDMSGTTPYSGLAFFSDWLQGVCEYSLQTKGLKTLMDYPDDFKFDLIIFEASGGECLLGLKKRFGSPPVIAVNSFSHIQWLNHMVGNPENPAYVANVLQPYTDRMTFFQRMDNFLFQMYGDHVYFADLLPKLDAFTKKYLGPSAGLPSQEIRQVSMVMVSTHPTFDYPRPLLPTVRNIAGIHIKDPEPLPKDLQAFLDDAKEGAIFFSLGSNLRSDKLREDKRKAIIEAFAELPQKVLWKWESDSLPGQPKNVKVGKWLPQKDILAHPNVRLFITHSGLLSTQEAIYRAVPVLGIPFFADQQINIKKAIDHGVGIKLAFGDITKETLLKAIRTVLNNPSYAKNMRELSERFRDRPQPPLQEAVYWCEYVLRHKGAQHLRSAAMDLSLYQYLLLDVLAVILVGVLTPIVLIAYCCKALFCRSNKKQKLKKQ